MAEVIFVSNVSGNFSTLAPPGESMMGAAAPMTLCGAMKMRCVATAMKAPAENALLLT
jgi:hypothetical protein